jgi:hypothetical protein
MPVIADVIASALFLIVIRFIKYLRVIPGWGPMLLAVVDTLRDSTVLLYLAVMIGLQLACAFAFHIAFGSENNHFSSITRSFITVFRMVRKHTAALNSKFTRQVFLCRAWMLSICQRSFMNVFTSINH